MYNRLGEVFKYLPLSERETQQIVVFPVVFKFHQCCRHTATLFAQFQNKIGSAFAVPGEVKESADAPDPFEAKKIELVRAQYGVGGLGS